MHKPAKRSVCLGKNSKFARFLVCHLLADYLESIDKNYEKASLVYKTTCDDYKYAKSCSKYATYALLGKGAKNQTSKRHTVILTRGVIWGILSLVSTRDCS
jgi:hypothetical protein